MLKKAALAVFALVLGMTLAAPQKAEAQVHVGVFLGAPVAYGAVVAEPAPYYSQPAYGYYNGPYYNGPYYVAPPAPAYYGGGYYDYGGRREWREGWRHHGHWRDGDRGEHHRRWDDDDR
jgi:hypothetical protein